MTRASPWMITARESSGSAILTTFGRPPYLAPRCLLPPLAVTRAHYKGGSHHALSASGRQQPSLPRLQPVDSPTRIGWRHCCEQRRAARGNSHAFFLSARCSRPHQTELSCTRLVYTGRGAQKTLIIQHTSSPSTGKAVAPLESPDVLA